MNQPDIDTDLNIDTEKRVKQLYNEMVIEKKEFFHKNESNNKYEPLEINDDNYIYYIASEHP